MFMGILLSSEYTLISLYLAYNTFYFDFLVTLWVSHVFNFMPLCLYVSILVTTFLYTVVSIFLEKGKNGGFERTQVLLQK